MTRTKKGRHQVIKYGFILTLLLPILTGCWSAHEVNDLAIVNAMGIDQKENGQLEVTTVIVKPSELFPEIGGSGHHGRQAYLVKTETGKNMLEAMEKLSNALPEKIYFGHLDTVVFGKYSANSIKDCLDFFNRGNDFRPNIKLLVADGLAKDIISEPPKLNSIIGLEIQDLVRTRQFGTTQMVQDISQFTEKMDEPTEDPYTGVISLERSKTDTIPTSKTASGIGGNGNSVRTEKNLNGSNHEQEDRSSTLELKGTAVFKGSRFVGVLNEPETQGFLLVKGGLKNSVVTLGCGSGDTGNVGVEINDSKATLTPEFSQGKPSMSVSISVNADIGQYTCKQGHLNTEKIGELNQQFERVLKQQVEATLNVAQMGWQTDIFGFGRAFYRKDPVQWKPMAHNWKNGILKEMDVKVKVTANINRYGLRKEPTYVNETR